MIARRSFGGTLALLFWLVGVHPGAAQELTLKRDLPALPAPGCAPAAPIPPVAPERRAEADRLADQGNQAALLGDNDEAVALLRRAAGLNPANPDVAYRLGRALEEGGQAGDAVGAYCRYLALAPAGDDAAEVRSRLAALPASAEGERAERAAARFRTGVAAFGRGELVAAEQAFDEAAREAPELATAFFNRGLVRAARNDARGAAEDLRRYLELQPAAPDREAVRQRIAALGERPPPRLASEPPRAAEPAASRRVPPQGGSGVLAGSLVVPGLGQFVTGRPALGALVLGGAAAAVAVGLLPQERPDSIVYSLPFGGTYSEPVTVRERTNLVPGLAVAAAITAAGAIEAYLHTRRTGRTAALPARGDSSPLGLVVHPEPDGVRFGVEMRVGR